MFIEMLVTTLIYAHDCDTIRVEGQTYRLQGLNCPETSAQFSTCPTRAGKLTEVTHGLKAKAVLLERLKESKRKVVLVSLGRDGAVEKDRYGRRLGRLVLDGRDWADEAVDRGIAEPYTCRANHCPKRKGWCE